MISLWWESQSTTRSPDGGDLVDMTLQSLELDILEAETSDTSQTVTSHPVERGLPISDHTIPQQNKISLDVVISDSPMSARLASGASVGDGGIINTPDSVTRSNDTLQILKRLVRDGTPVDVDGLRFEVSGYMIEKVSEAWNSDSAGALVANLALVEVAYASTRQVSAPTPRVERARPSSEDGDQAPTPTVTAPRRSLALSGLLSVRGISH